MTKNGKQSTASKKNAKKAPAKVEKKQTAEEKRAAMKAELKVKKAQEEAVLAAEKKAKKAKEEKAKPKKLMDNDEQIEEMKEFGVHAHYRDSVDGGIEATIAFGANEKGENGFELSFPEKNVKTAQRILNNLYVPIRAAFDAKVEAAVKAATKAQKTGKK